MRRRALQAFASLISPARFVYGLALFRSAGNSGPYYEQTTIAESDLLARYSWDQEIPFYQGPPVTIHYALATGLAVNSFTYPQQCSYGFGQGYGFTYIDQVTKSSLGLPLQFSAIYEPFDFAGIGVLAFANFSAFTPSYGGSIVLEARF